MLAWQKLWECLLVLKHQAWQLTTYCVRLILLTSFTWDGTLLQTRHFLQASSFSLHKSLLFTQSSVTKQVAEMRKYALLTSCSVQTKPQVLKSTIVDLRTRPSQTVSGGVQQANIHWHIPLLCQDCYVPVHAYLAVLSKSVNLRRLLSLNGEKNDILKCSAWQMANVFCRDSRWRNGPSTGKKCNDGEWRSNCTSTISHHLLSRDSDCRRFQCSGCW